MEIAKWIVNIVHIILALSLIVIVLLQSGKQAGLSGSIAGGAETFFGKNKGRTIDALLSKYTAVAAIAFLGTSIALYLLMK
ncbi:preprotein translocase subunit SecG [Ruminiclostridium herbifermentans]|uniref:Protein-export membrane protein SecG n=1 Tax=Ruminiclostridium herbifermentans TaxID=2488810 RepID=A0A4U7JB12_9FIRM|nr:preprotein translocase subunit SecG [Ruminiclostridium herbifermentans]QNU67875.1 preprotein translocase subunit SecG [Ruminiclostridium herbifermentans]